MLRGGLFSVGPLVLGIERFRDGRWVHRGLFGLGLERFSDLRFGGHSCRVHLTPERRDLDRLCAELHVGEAEAPADDPAVPKELLDLMRMRRCPDVEILRMAIQQEIADAPADQIRDVVMLVEPVKNFEGAGIDVSARDRVGRTRDDGRLRHRTAV